MQPIEFHAPGDVAEACGLLAEFGDDAAVLAGGQSLIQLLKQRVVGADHLVHVGDLEELRRIRREDDRVWIGAAVTYEQARRSEVVADAVGVLPEMIATVGDTQVRSRGTLIGGIAHADPRGDPPVLAVALDATLRLRSTRGTREVPASAFYYGLFDTECEDDELVVEAGFPILGDRTGASYRSFAPRRGDYAVASVAAVIELDDEGRVADATLVVGAVGDAPQRLETAREGLVGERPDGERLEAVVAEASEEAEVVGDEEWSAEYKRALVGTLVEDALAAAIEDVG